jgi:hypothetical protein
VGVAGNLQIIAGPMRIENAFGLVGQKDFDIRLRCGIQGLVWI